MKPQLGLAMLDRAHTFGALAPASWVTADETYVQNPIFRTWLVVHLAPMTPASKPGSATTAATATSHQPSETRCSTRRARPNGAAPWQKGVQDPFVSTDLNTLFAALYIKIDD
jgi:hypothetical protein